MKEVWKKIKDFEGYEVSNLGKVRSVDRNIICKNGIIKKFKGKELFKTISKIDKRNHKPRARVQLWKKDKAYLRQIHRLVAETFLPNPNNKPTVNHINGDPLNNRVDNLEWSSYSENQKHAYDTGLATVRKNYYPSNIKAVIGHNPITGDVIETLSAGEMARLLGVNISSVTNCARRNQNQDLKEYKCCGYILKYK